MTMWNDYEKIARRLDRIANAFERIANAIETANIIEADRKTEPQTDCAWQNDEFIPTELASTMLKERFKEKK